MTQAAAVFAQGLEKRFGNKVVLRGIDLHIPRGAIYGVLGPSGAGKTTLVKALGLVSPPSSGKLELFGTAHTENRAGLRRRIGYMPQQAALYEELSAFYNIEFFSRGASEQRINGLLDMLGLADRAADPVQEFSGGMKQRVSLACALSTEPELLLLDEPTAGIDPVLRMRFWDEFRRLRDNGATLLVSTHQIDEALHCDRLLVIREGEVLVESPPDELLRLGGAEATATRRDGQTVDVEFSEPNTELLDWLREHGVDDLASLQLRYDTLEDILIKLIQQEGGDA